DLYSAGSSRGNGATGIWAADTLHVSKNFIDSRTLASGPIRVMFELDYPPYDVNGTQVTETRRIALDAGSQLDHYQVTFKTAGAAWDKAGKITTADAWKKYIDEFAQKARSPIEVTVSAQ